MTTTAGKKRGYRIKLQLFVPADPSDMGKVMATISFAQGLNKVPDGAPAGAVVEKFATTPGFEGDKE